MENKFKQQDIKLLPKHDPDMVYLLIDGKEYPYKISEAEEYFMSSGAIFMGSYGLSDHLRAMKQIGCPKCQGMPKRYKLVPDDTMVGGHYEAVLCGVCNGTGVKDHVLDSFIDKHRFTI